MQHREAMQFGIPRTTTDVRVHGTQDLPERLDDIAPPGSGGQTLPGEETRPYTFKRQPDKEGIASSLKTYVAVA